MGGRRDQGVPAGCQASSLLPDISDACVLLAPGCLGLVMGTWQRPAPLLCCVLVHFRKQRRGHSHREESSRQRAVLRNGYLSLQTISLLPALDTVLANMCDCWKCNDDYLHI